MIKQKYGGRVGTDEKWEGKGLSKDVFMGSKIFDFKRENQIV
jgi:hypothetical protein